jgi:hypothetical protein
VGLKSDTAPQHIVCAAKSRSSPRFKLTCPREAP